MFMTHVNNKAYMASYTVHVCTYTQFITENNKPPVANIGKPGKELAMADTARNAIGLMALPDTPP